MNSALGLAEPAPGWLAKTLVGCADEAGVGIVATLVPPERGTLYVNEGLAHIIGMAADELLALPPLVLFEKIAPERLDDIAGCLAGPFTDPFRFRTTFTKNDGRTLALDVSMGLLELDNGRVVVTSVVDVSGRREAIASLKRSEDRFRGVIESAPQAIYITEGITLRYANPAFLRLFGVSEEASILDASILQFAHPSDAERLAERARSYRTTPMQPTEYRMLSRTGQAVTLEASAIPVEYDGRPMVLWYGHDVTERKEMVAQLMQSDRLAMLGTLAGGIAHAINNPLSYLMLNLEHLSRRLPLMRHAPAYRIEAQTRLSEALNGAERIAEVVRRMRAYSRARKRKEPEAVDVQAVLNTALALVENEIRHRGKLTTHFEPIPPVWGSEGQLEQALLSLLVHAARSLPEAPGITGKLRLTCGVDEKIQGVSLTIRFNATIAAQPESYEPFVGAGEGLGLAVCRDIVAALGGSVSVEERPGPVTVIRVVLPPARTVRPAVANPSPCPESESPLPMEALHARVLVVDDDPGVANALRLMLQDQHDVTSVQGGREALRLLLEGADFDIVFCDLLMPDISGVDLYYSLELNRPGFEQRIVFMTGGVFTPEAERFVLTVSNPRIEKPFNLKAVERLLNNAAGRRTREAQGPASESGLPEGSAVGRSSGPSSG